MNSLKLVLLTACVAAAFAMPQRLSQQRFAHQAAVPVQNFAPQVSPQFVRHSGFVHPQISIEAGFGGQTGFVQQPSLELVINPDGTRQWVQQPISPEFIGGRWVQPQQAFHPQVLANVPHIQPQVSASAHSQTFVPNVRNKPAAPSTGAAAAAVAPRA